jgi:hypothetical protein
MGNLGVALLQPTLSKYGKQARLILNCHHTMYLFAQTDELVCVPSPSTVFP